MELWRGIHPDRKSDGTCWAPDPCSALSFLLAGGFDGRGRLLRADLDTDAVTIDTCEGMVQAGGFDCSADGCKHIDAVFAADDPAFRQRHADDGTDWLIYGDAPANTIYWHRGLRKAGPWNVGPRKTRHMNDRVHLRNFVCWRVISEDGRAALDIQEERTIDQDELTRLVVAQYPPCEACGCIPIEVGKTKFCSTCATRTMREKFGEGLTEALELLGL